MVKVELFCRISLFPVSLPDAPCLLRFAWHPAESLSARIALREGEPTLPVTC